MNFRRNAGMPDRINHINKQEVLARLKANRDTHLSDFNEAMEGYRLKCSDKLGEAKTQFDREILALKERFDAGETPELSIHKSIEVERPVSYVAEYDAVIDMIEADVREVQEITSTEFVYYMRNEWEWSKTFNSTVEVFKSYSSTRRK